MSSLSEYIYNGGLQHLDDRTFSGGQVVKCGSSVNMIVGDKVNHGLLNMRLEWDAILKIHWGSKKNVDHFITSVCKMFNMPRVENIDELYDAVKQIYELDEYQLTHMFLKIYKIYDPIIATIRPLYSTWRQHLEKLVVQFNDLRTKHIQQHCPDQSKKINNIPALMNKWDTIDKKYNIQSSSKLLLYINPPNKPHKLPWVHQKAKWDVPKFHISIDCDGVRQPLKVFKKELSVFTYLGFCPCRPIHRLTELFKFPVAELIDCIHALGGDVDTDYCGLNDKLQHIDVILRQPTKQCMQINKRDVDVKNNIDGVIDYINELMNIFLQLKPAILAHEKYYVDICKKYAMIATKFEKINRQYVLKK